MPAVLKILDIECSYESAKVLDGINFSVERGSFTGIIGPNGSGKSTLLRCISRVLKPSRGSVLLEEQDLKDFKSSEIARVMAVVPQETSVNFSFTVEEIVMMGRSPHLGRFQQESSEDYEIVKRAMELTNTGYLAKRSITAVSGGERQRVIIARALAQEPEVLLLDEPTSHLDINHQLEILNLLQSLNREKKLTVVSVFHDLNHAAQYCDNLVLMDKGCIFDMGSPEEVLTGQNIKSVYGSNVMVKKTAAGRPSVMLMTQNYETCQTRGRIHVFCGGGAGSDILELLVNHGYEVTAGVLNSGDYDWDIARFLEIETAEEVPFSSISEESYNENIELIKKSGACIVACIPFGSGNLKNLQAASYACDLGKPVVLVEEQCISERDFTGGQAEAVYNKLKEMGAVVVKSGIEVLDVLAGMGF